MVTCVHIWKKKSRRILLRMRNVSDKNFEKIKTSLPKTVLFIRYVEICGRAGQATDDYNTAHALCMLDN
jgi:hypothetical protein